jgi:hypothetical protein
MPDISINLVYNYSQTLVTLMTEYKRQQLFFSVALRPNAGHGLLILEIF